MRISMAKESRRRLAKKEKSRRRVPRFRSPREQHRLLGHYCVNPKKMDDGIRRLNAEFIPMPANHPRRRLSLDFLPQPPPYTYSHERVLTDSRGGLLAFVEDNWYAVVCDPRTRQYRKVRFPWGQDDDDSDWDCSYHCIGVFLLDADDDDGSGSRSPMSRFRVLCVCLVLDYMSDTIKAHSCVYSARHNRWLRSWSVTRKNIGHGHWTDGCSSDLLDTYKRIVGRAGGSIFWSGHRGHVLAVDESTGQFSKFRLPVAARSKHHSSKNLRVVGGGGAGLRIVRLVDGDLEVLLLTARGHHGARECTVERRAGLHRLANIEDRPDQSWRFVDAATTPAALVLGAFSDASISLFCLNVETMKLQRLNEKTTMIAGRVFPYELPYMAAHN
ncbi:unnamed protein product [Urochloa decumbens]|uniref:Uncharacterized protein n=1 Tax=Urochloa decumbens TaxID=240449 RepID=A0ABC8VIC4_9POAL